jgi:hypothetical protein
VEAEPVSVVPIDLGDVQGNALDALGDILHIAGNLLCRGAVLLDRRGDLRSDVAKETIRRLNHRASRLRS